MITEQQLQVLREIIAVLPEDTYLAGGVGVALRCAQTLLWRAGTGFIIMTKRTFIEYLTEFSDVDT